MFVATVQLEPESVALGQTIRLLPEVTFGAERIAAHSTEWTMPCLWASYQTFSEVDEALENDPSVNKVVESREYEKVKYYHVDWSDPVKQRIDAYLDKKGSMLAARGTAGGWRLRIRFATREQFDVFRETLNRDKSEFELLNLTESGSPMPPFGSLTPEQHAALVAALEHGYYHVPREATVEDIADELGKSHQAVSKLLRRGTQKIVQEKVTIETRTGEFNLED